jgi:hypothetical protein
MMIEGIYDGFRRNHFRGPVSPERSSAMMSTAQARRRRGPAGCGEHDGARLRGKNRSFAPAHRVLRHGEKFDAIAAQSTVTPRAVKPMRDIQRSFRRHRSAFCAEG